MSKCNSLKGCGSSYCSNAKCQLHAALNHLAYLQRAMTRDIRRMDFENAISERVRILGNFGIAHNLLGLIVILAALIFYSNHEVLVGLANVLIFTGCSLTIYQTCLRLMKRDG